MSGCNLICRNKFGTELFFGIENSQFPKRNALALEKFLKRMMVINFTTDNAKYAAEFEPVVGLKLENGL
jgi:hypothetical protein